MRILFVVGIQSPKMYLAGWESDFPRFFPEAEIHYIDDFYLHLEYDKIEAITQKGVEILKDGKETIILAHSFGGILGKTMISRAENANVRLLCTLASPHEMRYAGLSKAKKFLKTPSKVPVPCLSFGGYFDPICPFWKTQMVDAPHENLPCDHLSFLLSPWIRQQVAESILSFLEKGTGE